VPSVEANIPMMLLILVVLLGFSAYFSGSETALMAISRLRLRHILETKPRRARFVEKVLKRPERLIGSILLGNNLVNVAMTAIATSLAISIWPERGIIYVTIVLTIVILIFAEITPKVYAKYFNEKISLVTAPILNVLMLIFSPVITLITYISSKLLLIIGVDLRKIKSPLMTEAEILTCIKMGWDEGAITGEESKMLSTVFTLNDKTVGEVMVPKDGMVFLDADSQLDDILRVILKTGHSRFPVREGVESNITGFIHAKDLFVMIEEKRSGSIKEIIRPAYFISEDKKIDSLLRGFQSKKLHQAVVLDAEGKVTGLITLEDILEQLVGSIQDEHD
jgi:putative hemolysin